MDDFVLVADPIVCLQLAREAAATENTAMQWDMRGVADKAIEAYRDAATKLREAACACPEGHPDAPLMEGHATEVIQRMEYLKKLDGAPAAMPIYKHILPVQLTLGCPEALPDSYLRHLPSISGESHTAAQVMGAAAAVTGATGLLVLGPISGAALGVATALATTREDDTLGSAARKLGIAGLILCSQAQKISREHQLCRRLVSAGGATLQSTVSQARHTFSHFAAGHLTGVHRKGRCMT